jgi:aminocyclitol acetyltransferase
MTELAKPYILSAYQNGRELITYCDGAEYEPQKHYVIIEPPAVGWTAAPKLAELGFKPYEDYYDTTNPHMWGLPVDWKFGETSIGKCTFYNNPEQLRFAGMLFFTSVGRFCSINETVYFQHNHPMNMLGTGRFQQLFDMDKQAEYFQTAKADVKNSPNSAEKITIGNDVWIGANVFINVSRCSKIGDGAIIAAGSIVNADVPPFAVVAGTPAKVKKYRYTERQIETLLRVKWWDWSDAEIKANADLLIHPEKFFQTFND